MAAIRNAVLGCTSEAGYRYRSTIFHRIKRQRGMPVGWRYKPIHRKSHGALSTFEDDVPVYPSHEFLYNSMVWRKERARLAGHLRRLSQLMCSVEWTNTVCSSSDGYHSLDFPRSLDPGLVELNIRRLMGDAAFSASETALLNRQLNRWETSVFRVHIWWDAHHFSHHGCPLLALAVEVAVAVHSEDIDTEQSTDLVLSDAYDSDHMLAKRVLPYFPQDGNPEMVARFLDHVQDEIRQAAELVMLTTEQQQLRWQPLVAQTHPAYAATIQLAKRRYFSRLARVFAKRLLKRQLLHYQGALQGSEKSQVRQRAGG
jgi:hypothetical protein